jgi:hypothetical protein
MIVFVISLVLLLCGCQEKTKTDKSNIDENIELESDVVELVYADLIQNKDNGEVISVDVEYLFRNIAGRTINFNVTAEFYDEDNNRLYIGGPKIFKGIIENYTETVVLEGTNIISYNDVNASKVDHVKIIARES